MLEVRELTKIYKSKKSEDVKALENVNISFEEKGMVFILGKSGSGKSTLLNLIGGLDTITSGEVIVKGKSSKDFSQADFDSYRNTFVGFIFQEYNILNEFDVGQNIALALELQGKKADKEAVNNILQQVDLQGYANRKPKELSGGQKQRVAIARALIKDPEIIMADEPTGALDSNTGKQVFETLQKLSKNKLVIIISHDREYAEFYGDRVIEFSDGKIISDIKKYLSKPTPVSNNVNMIDNSVLYIKKGQKLSKEDRDRVLDFLDNSNEELIVSKNARSNKDFLKQARIDKEGNKESFENTKNSNLAIKQYDSKDFKMIKSKLPFKHSFKMGASGLKVKPIRLFITILLSTIAFGLFGVSDSLGAYNKYTTAYNSIEQQKIEFATLNKRAKIGNREYFTETTLNEDDVKMIEGRFPEYEFNKVYGFEMLGSNYKQNVYEMNNSRYYDNFYTGYMISSKTILEGYGFNIYGEYPTTVNEIAISKFLAEMYVDYGYCYTSTSNEKITIPYVTDMIGKQLVIGKKTLKVTAIVDTKFDSKKYEIFKKPELSSEEYLLYSEFQSVKEYGYHSLFFVKEHLIELSSELVFSPVSRNHLSLYYPLIGTESFSSIQYMGYFNREPTKEEIVFFDENKTELDTDEVVLDLLTLRNHLGYRQSQEMLQESENITREYFENKYNPLMHDSLIDRLVIEYFIRALECDEEAAITHIQSLNKTPFEIYIDYLHDDNLIFGESYDKVLDKNVLEKTVKDIVAGFGTSIDFNMSCLEESALEAYIINKKIVGVIAVEEYASKSLILFNKIEFRTSFTDFGNINFIITKFKHNRKQDIGLIKFSYQNHDNQMYDLQNPVMISLNQVNSFIESLAKIFLYIGIGFAVFSTLLLYNFISTSINYKQREIGVLRAVGARSKDVFSIFFSEGFLITLISFVTSFIVSIFVVSILNGEVMKMSRLTVLNLSMRQFILMLAISIITAIISSFMPVYRIARKKPVEAIRNS